MAQIRITEYKVFFDFDNTISKIDVVDAFLEKFSTNKSLWLRLEKEWQDGIIGSEDCLVGQMALCSPSEREIVSFLDSIKIDPGFLKLLDFLRQNEIFFAIVSDSFVYFIKYILEKNNLKNIPIYANNFELNNGKISLSFPNRGSQKDKTCGKCANCKREKLSLGPQKKTIYIGDGFSDMCAAKHCNVVFAKDKLLQFGKENKFSWIEFNNMTDILSRLTKYSAVGEKSKVLIS